MAILTGGPRWHQTSLLSFFIYIITTIVSTLGPVNVIPSKTKDNPETYDVRIALIILSGTSLGANIVLTSLYLLQRLSPILVSFSIWPLPIAWLAVVGYSAGLAGTSGILWRHAGIHVAGRL